MAGGRTIVSGDAPMISREQQELVNNELLKAVRMSDYTERMNLCMQKGADIDAVNWEKQTPLMLAVKMASPTRVTFILKKNPDLFKKDKNGSTAFDLANGCTDTSTKKQMMDLLLKALPDGASYKGQDNTVETQPDPQADDKGISVSKPIRLSGKQPVSKPGGGFTL